jgi:hypothetical protein
MNIPENVMEIFKKEAQNIEYGKVTLGIIRRGGNHQHYEIYKQITIIENGDDEKNTFLEMIADEGGKVVYKGKNDD